MNGFDIIRSLISEVGFPIVVAGYLLIRVDELLRELLKSQLRMENHLNDLVKKK